MIILFKYTSPSMSGWEFVRADVDALQFSHGNSAATAERLHSYDLEVRVASKSELKGIRERLISNGALDLGRG